jgi:hypothetical protein
MSKHGQSSSNGSLTVDIDSVHPNTREQIRETYRTMAKKARYRPMAPSNGFGNITVPVHKLDLEKESNAYVQHWWRQEEATRNECKHRTFLAMCVCDYKTRPVLIYIIEAAKALCSCDNALALDLLKLAVKDLEADLKNKTLRKTMFEGLDS